MNANDNVFSGYSFGAVFIEEAPILTVTASVVYWDETDSDAAESESVSRLRLPNTQSGMHGLLYCHQGYRWLMMAGRLAA